VVVDLICDKTKWTLQVKDQGIGISRKAQRQLFREFYRGDNAINSKIVGSGIGLLLVKKYVTMHDGEISFESQENAGSTFKVVVPCKEMTIRSNQELKPNQHNDFPVSEDNPAPPLPDQETTLEKEMKILVVEDNDDLLNFMKTSLADKFRVLVAGDGNTAWKNVLKHQPDLVVSDIMMPGMDGFELCRLMKSTYETSHIPIILLTALSEKSDQLHGLGLGADDYLTKPFDMNMLVQKIKSIIHNREIVKGKSIKTNQ
jgi:CheY-like chemotaxis protein